MTVAVFLLLLLGAVPIALVLALTAMWYIQASGNTVLFDSYPQQLFSAIESYGLLAIPLFMLAGELMNEGGLTKRLIALARILYSARYCESNRSQAWDSPLRSAPAARANNKFAANTFRFGPRELLPGLSYWLGPRPGLWPGQGPCRMIMIDTN